MKWLQRFFRKGFIVDSRSLEWTRIGSLEVGSGRVWLGDATFLPAEDDGVVVDLPVGSYDVAYKAVAFDGGWVVVRMRFALSGTYATLGEQMAKTWTDTATQAVADFGSALSFFDPDHMTDEEAVALMDVDTGRMEVLKRGDLALPVALAHTGLGDGEFPVFELVAGGGQVGFEVEFIADGVDLILD